MNIKIELTDLFGGEANYSWVKRETLDLPESTKDREIVKAAKAAMDYTGYRTITENYGDMIKLDFTPSGILHVMFITFE